MNMDIVNQKNSSHDKPDYLENGKEIPGPIFIVGVSRSGTTLMRNILNESDQIGISRENHFLGHLLGSEGMRYKFQQFGDLSVDENVHKLVDFIYSGEIEKSSKLRRISAHWRWILRRIDRDVFLQKVLDSDRSERALFTIMMECFAERKGKQIIGEKTPAHIRYVPTLMDWYPNARVIHMIRDPRAVFVSEYNRRLKEAQSVPFKQLKKIPYLLKLYLLAQTTVTWAESINLYHQYSEKYPGRYYALKFEDLVREPEKNISNLCNYLGVEFQEKMLHQSVVSMGFQAGKSGFDSQAADRWKKNIDPWMNTWLTRHFRQELRALGY
ncbi:MAG: sulfotransferase [Chloroflexi bacterium]|nr:MAG: sulfotransferase [Chloroflexota bacterium]